MKRLGRVRLTVAGTLVLAIGGGCATFAPDPAPARMSAPDPALQADVKGLQEWRQGVRLDMENQARETEVLRKRVQALEAALAEHRQAVKAQIQDLEVGRERDKKFLEDELTRKVLELQKALTPARPPAPVAPVRGSGYEHVVKAGETLSEIARAYKVGLDSILKANNLKDGNTIRVGQKLFIPD